MKAVWRTGWQRWGGTVEGAMLLLFGVYLIFLAADDSYGLLLNPKFKWLTGTAGFGLTLIGLICCIAPNPLQRSRAAAFMLFLGLIFVHGGGFSMNGNPAFETDSMSTGQDEAASGPARVTKNGREYIRINLGELYDIGEVGSEEQKKQSYLVRGILRIDNESVNKECYLLRTAVSCCLADAVAVGFRLDLFAPDELSDGQWVNIYARLQPVSTLLKKDREPGIEGVFYTSINEHFRLVVDLLEPITPPPVPAMFDFQQQEPYAY